jgi:glycosyltransferase involved in cell wall biosynthesis
MTRVSAAVAPSPTRYVLLGDAESPHLLKWARALAALPGLELWVVSSRGFAPGFDALLPPQRRLALATQPHAGGGNVALLRQLPRLARWLQRVEPAVLHAHYLTSHGTLAWLAQRLYGVRGALVASAWGSDILVTPERSAAARWLTRRVLQASVLSTSDSQVMAQRMQALGAREPMVFPFGLEALPAAPATGTKDDLLFFANRGLEPVYAPHRVLALFAASAPAAARLVVANDGSLRQALQAQAQALGIDARVQFVGRLDAATQAGWYARSRWYLSLPASDSVAVSVLEAMAHGCVPLLSDLPANRELVRQGQNGWIVPDGGEADASFLALLPRADAIAQANRQWVAAHALFGPCVQAFVQRLQAVAPQAFAARAAFSPS